MIIAVEGIDGAGKTTLINQLATELRQQTNSTVTTEKFPRYGQGIHAHLAKQGLHGKLPEKLNSPYPMALLFALDRAQRVWHLNQYQGNTDNHIIIDRYIASSAAYTWALTRDEKAVNHIKELETELLEIPAPDLQILLRANTTTAAQRINQRAEQKDTYERDQNLQQRTHNHYRHLASRSWLSPWLITNGSDINTLTNIVTTTLGLEQ